MGVTQYQLPAGSRVARSSILESKVLWESHSSPHVHEPCSGKYGSWFELFFSVAASTSNLIMNFEEIFLRGISKIAPGNSARTATLIYTFSQQIQLYEHVHKHCITLGSADANSILQCFYYSRHTISACRHHMSTYSDIQAAVYVTTLKH